LHKKAHYKKIERQINSNMNNSNMNKRIGQRLFDT